MDYNDNFIQQCLATYEGYVRVYASDPKNCKHKYPFAREKTRIIHEPDLPEGLAWQQVDKLLQAHEVEWNTRVISMAEHPAKRGRQ